MAASLYGLAYSDAALSFLEKVSRKHAAQIRGKIASLVEDPRPRGSTIVRGASNKDNKVFRIRSGDYRVLYAVREGPQVAILDIDHRRDVYRGAKKHKKKGPKKG